MKTDNYSFVVASLKNRGISTQESIQLANKHGGRKSLTPLSKEELEAITESIYEGYQASLPDWFDLIDFD
jgi:hypothetical protein